MKYMAINELLHFEFHDANLKKIKFKNNHMIWKVSYIAATTRNKTNEKFYEDTGIKKATITFENFHIESIVFPEAPITAAPSEYNNTLKKKQKSYKHCFIYYMDNLTSIDTNQYKTSFSFGGGLDQNFLTIQFSKSIIEWNKYTGTKERYRKD